MLPVLKFALKATGGRSALVSTLAKFLAPLITRFVGKQAGAALSRALVEAGLRLINLETAPEDEQRAAGTAVASVVEDTVRNVAALPAHVLGDETLLEGFVLEAFERAAARSLPQILPEETYLDRPDLRQDLALRGAWVAMPLRGRPYYRKYTRMPLVSVSPYHAARLRTFRGVPLADVLHARLGLPPGATLRARVHLYEAVPGTTVTAIARGEQQVPGLADAGGPDAPLLHPLTPEAAGLLLGEPALGEEADPRHLDGQLLGVGQRLYHLEVTEPKASGARPFSRPGRARVTLRFPDDTVVAELVLSEPEAQALAAALRRGQPVGTVLAPLVGRLRQRIGSALDGDRLRVVHGAVPPGLAAAALRRVPASARARLASVVESGLTRGLGSVLKEHREAFITATEALADGVTVRVGLTAPHVLSELSAALTGTVPAIRGADAPPADVTVVAGHDSPLA